MSRSRKKTPGWCDRGPWWKRYANKRLRQVKGEVSNGNRYKRHTCSYDICDWKHLLWTLQDVQKRAASDTYRAYMK